MFMLSERGALRGDGMSAMRLKKSSACCHDALLQLMTGMMFITMPMTLSMASMGMAMPLECPSSTPPL